MDKREEPREVARGRGGVDGMMAQEGVHNTSNGLVHRPVCKLTYPYQAIDYPYPLCGLTSLDAVFEWTDEEASCQKCENKWRILEANRPVEQLGFELTETG